MEKEKKFYTFDSINTVIRKTTFSSHQPKVVCDTNSDGSFTYYYLNSITGEKITLRLVVPLQKYDIANVNYYQYSFSDLNQVIYFLQYENKKKKKVTNQCVNKVVQKLFEENGYSSEEMSNFFNKRVDEDNDNELWKLKEEFQPKGHIDEVIEKINNEENEEAKALLIKEFKDSYVLIEGYKYEDINDFRTCYVKKNEVKPKSTKKVKPVTFNKGVFRTHLKFEENKEQPSIIKKRKRLDAVVNILDKCYPNKKITIWKIDTKKSGVKLVFDRQKKQEEEEEEKTAKAIKFLKSSNLIKDDEIDLLENIKKDNISLIDYLTINNSANVFNIDLENKPNSISTSSSNESDN